MVTVLGWDQNNQFTVNVTKIMPILYIMHIFNVLIIFNYFFTPNFKEIDVDHKKKS